MNLVSNCCGAAPYLNNWETCRCSDCKENCDFIEID